MHSPRQIWQTIRARTATLLKLRPDAPARPHELEREVMAVTRETRLLAVELQQIRDESERAVAEDKRMLAILDQACQDAKTTLDGETKRLADLERRVAGLETERLQSLERFKSIETSLADTLSRLDTIDDQVRVFNDRSREQAKEFGASLSRAITRLNTTDTRLDELRHTTLQQVMAVETAIADTSQRVVTIEASLVDATTRLETIDGRIRTQEQKLDLEHQLYLHTVQEIQSQVRSQDQRLGWTMMAAVFAMLLGSVAGGILIWDVQKNAKILGGIRTEVRRLDSAMGQSRLTGDPPGVDEPVGRQGFSHAGQHNISTDRNVVGKLPLSGP